MSLLQKIFDSKKEAAVSDCSVLLLHNGFPMILVTFRLPPGQISCPLRGSGMVLDFLTYYLPASLEMQKGS